MKLCSLSGLSRLTGYSFQIKLIFGLLASTIFIGDFPSAYAQTATNPTLLDSGEAAFVDAKFYAEAYGVSYEEALKRLSIMFDIGAEIDAAESEKGDDFAGTYFDNIAEEFALVVRTNKAKKPARILTRNVNRLIRTGDVALATSKLGCDGFGALSIKGGNSCLPSHCSLKTQNLVLPRSGLSKSFMIRSGLLEFVP